MKTIIEPFRIKVIEPLKMTTRQERLAALKKAGFNVFLIPAEDVLIDLLTDSGTGAMSSEQWAGVMRGDESYAGARSYYRFESRLREVTGFEHIIPTHQGRASERILFELIGGPDKVIPNNNHFDTTRANVEHSGATAVDLVIDEGKDPRARLPFKGDLDTRKLEGLFKEVGAKRIPCVMVTVTNNSGGGQPVSMANLKAVRAVCDQYDTPLILDACRFRKTPISSSSARRVMPIGRWRRSYARCSTWPTGRRSARKKTGWSTSAGCCSCAMIPCISKPRTC
jgi:tryptophanase